MATPDIRAEANGSAPSARSPQGLIRRPMRIVGRLLGILPLLSMGLSSAACEEDSSAPSSPEPDPPPRMENRRPIDRS